MKRIIVLGAGIGGMSVAYELRGALGKDRAAITVNISGLTLTNGFSAAGGAIYNSEALTLTDTESD